MTTPAVNKCPQKLFLLIVAQLKWLSLYDHNWFIDIEYINMNLAKKTTQRQQIWKGKYAIVWIAKIRRDGCYPSRESPSERNVCVKEQPKCDGSWQFLPEMFSYKQGDTFTAAEEEETNSNEKWRRTQFADPHAACSPMLMSSF